MNLLNIYSALPLVDSTEMKYTVLASEGDTEGDTGA